MIRCVQNIIIFLFCSGLLMACNSHDNKILKPDYCANEMALFIAPDTLPLLTIDFSLPLCQTYHQIEAALTEDFCWHAVNYGINMNRKRIKMSITEECPNDTIPIICGPYKGGKIRLNAEGEILFDRTVLNEIDSLSTAINAFFPKRPPYDYISIWWKPSTPIDSIQKAFNHIIDGSLMVYEELAMSHFQRSICELNLIELDSLKKIHPFQITFNLPNCTHIPPPPSETIN